MALTMHNICVGIFLLCVGKTEEAVLGLAAKWQIKHLHKIELPTQASEFADPLRQVEPPHPPSRDEFPRPISNHPHSSYIHPVAETAHVKYTPWIRGNWHFCNGANREWQQQCF